MKLVREHINEKFKEQSDPIEDMGIGVYNKKMNFKTSKEAMEFLISLIPAILNTDEIPSDILKQDGNWILPIYNDEIFKYYKNFITVNNNYLPYDAQLLAIELYKKGFKMCDYNYKFAKSRNIIE